MENESEIVVSPPTYLAGKKICCWKCDSRMSVVAIVTGIQLPDSLELESGILTQIVDLPPQIKDFIQLKVPTFKKIYSKTTESSYYGNTCPNCGVLTGDFFLHSEPGAPFFPTEESEAKTLYIMEIPLEQSVSIEAGISFGTGDFILENAKKL